jgi:hypothetical protein
MWSCAVSASLSVLNSTNAKPRGTFERGSRSKWTRVTAPNLPKISLKWSAVTLRVRFSTRSDATVLASAFDGLMLLRGSLLAAAAGGDGDVIAASGVSRFTVASRLAWGDFDRDFERDERGDEERLGP